jgi:hypothetical protein
MFALFAKLLDTNVPAASAIFHAIDPRAQRDIASALGRQRLSDDEFGLLAALLDRVKTAAAIRNRIVHGNWQIKIRISRHQNGTETGRSATWFRFYEPADPDELQRMFGPGRDRSLLAAHQFSLGDIGAHAGHAAQLAADLGAFTDACRLGPPPNPQPLEFS